MPVTATFRFTCDNQQLAIDEIEQQIKNLGLIVNNIEVTDTSNADNTDDDWFDDVVFTIKATITSDTLTDAEIKEKLNNANFEDCEY